MGSPPGPDAGLIEAVVAGRAEAIDRWYRMEHPRVWKLCLGFLADADRADDVAQDAMLHLLDKLDRWDDSSRWEPWRTSVVLNFCRDQVRRGGARRRAEERAGELEAAEPERRALPDPADEAARGELRGVIVDALSELSDREREAFVLRELEGLTAAETAGALGIGEGSVRTLLVLARRRLRTLLAPRLGYVE
jgi:RNA polymerase sigma-70 factor (ECF subfamily)